MTGAEERTALARRVQAGEWLTIGPAAVFLGIGRTTVHQLLSAGVIGYRVKPGTRHRVCDPSDLLRLRDEYEQVRRGTA